MFHHRKMIPFPGQRFANSSPSHYVDGRYTSTLIEILRTPKYIIGSTTVIEQWQHLLSYSALYVSPKLAYGVIWRMRGPLGANSISDGTITSVAGNSKVNFVRRPGLFFCDVSPVL